MTARRNAWLTYKNTIKEYIEPRYYEHLLKKYSFNKKSDLQIFSKWLGDIGNEEILELGSGSGRATRIVLRKKNRVRIQLVDLSPRMIDFARNKFHKNKGIKYFISDNFEFMNKTRSKFDRVFSLWSFSHSVHQHLHKKGIENGSIYIKHTLHKFIDKNMKRNGTFFLIHFDSMSEEQQILMQQWRKVFPIFKDSAVHQSPSKILLDDILLGLDQKNKIRLSIEHLEGEPIKYRTLDELLEIFLNFHLESFFNTSENINTIMREIKSAARRYRRRNGTYEIKPSCYIYTFTKISPLET